MKTDRLYLVHILESIGHIQQYTAEGRSAFIDERKTQDAVLRNLHTLSESVQRLSDSLRARYSEVDWRSIIAFRNVVVHNYLGVDLGQIWDIVETDIPELKRAVTAILSDLES